jgi:hypothetical protein
MEVKEEFVTHLANALETDRFVKLTLSKPSQKNADLKNLYAKPVRIKSGERISLTYHYSTRDEVKNHSNDQFVETIVPMLGVVFRAANLLTLDSDYQLLISKQGKMHLVTKVANRPSAIKDHDKSKKSVLNPALPYWFHLGIADRHGKVLPSMQHKFKQVNQYINIIRHHLEPLLSKDQLKIVDMGCGKGYLTFALYEFLREQKGITLEMIGIEQRPELVTETNLIAQKSGLSGLRFVAGSINDFAAKDTDVLIALHACDTATDDAIASGINSGAALIVCAPCCHKQIRQEIKASAETQPLLRYGIILERQAELLTDTLRALIMEKYGYKSHIQEFIEAEHTPKNLLLVGIKSQQTSDKDEIDAKIQKLKQEFGIKSHHLETLLKNWP